MSTAKYFFIKSRLNDLVLDVRGWNEDPGAEVVMWNQKSGWDSTNQLWCEDRGTWTIRAKLNDFCLEVTDDNKVVLNPYEEGNVNQNWIRCGPRVINKHDATRVLDIAEVNSEPGADICGYKYHGGPNQKWEFEFLDIRYFFIQSKMNGKVLDIRGGSADPGSDVIMWDKKDGESDNQLWYEDRHGQVRSKLNDFVMDSSKGDNLEMHPLEYGNDLQMWTVRNGKIVNMVDGKVLDIRGHNDDNGAEICTWDFKDSDNQLWEFEYVD